MKKAVILLPVLALLVTSLTGCGLVGRKQDYRCKRVGILDSRQTAICSLSQQDVFVSQQGNKIRFVLPTDEFFVADTDQFRHDRLAVLSLVVRIIKSYPHRQNLQIIGYSDNVGTHEYQMKLSKQRAKNVAAFFWAQGIHHRDMMVVGRGNVNHIASNSTIRGSGYNRRIEIRFDSEPIVNY